jgi:hypothetical protein
VIQLMKVSALCVHLHLGAPDTPTPQGPPATRVDADRR